MMMRKSLFKSLLGGLVAALCLLMLGGCLSTSSYHTARTLEPGKTEIGMAMEMMGSIDSDDDGILVNHPRVIARRGLTDNSDIGFMAGSYGTSVDYNFTYLKANSFALSANPYLGLQWQRMFGTETDSQNNMILQPMLALLADLGSRDGLAVTVGVKPGMVISRESEFSGSSNGTSSSSNAETLWFIAGSVGLRFDLEQLSLFPEINVIKVEDEEKLLWTGGIGVGF